MVHLKSKTYSRCNFLKFYSEKKRWVSVFDVSIFCLPKSKFLRRAMGPKNHSRNFYRYVPRIFFIQNRDPDFTYSWAKNTFDWIDIREHNKRCQTKKYIKNFVFRIPLIAPLNLKALNLMSLRTNQLVSIIKIV